MLDDKKRAEIDQASTLVGEALPAYWAEVYRGLNKHFNDQEAWELLKIYVSSMSGGSGKV